MVLNFISIFIQYLNVKILYITMSVFVINNQNPFLIIWPEGVGIRYRDIITVSLIPDWLKPSDRGS